MIALRKQKFSHMCKKCKYNKCRSSCKPTCGCVGRDKVHNMPYCKCYSVSNYKETRCYYYRKKREE